MSPTRDPEISIRHVSINKVDMLRELVKGFVLKGVRGR